MKFKAGGEEGSEYKQSRVRVLRRGAFAFAFAITATCSGVVATGGAPGQDPEPPSAGAAPRPNFVVIETDDQRLSAFNREVMPFTRRKIGAKGTLFRRAIVTSPFCCPSRASFLTGSYMHNHGAWHSYADFSDPASTLASWLQEDGYRTAMVGKYLNHYGRVVQPETRPAPGWDQWRMLLEPLSYYDYDVSVNGQRVHLGKRQRAYETTYLNREAAGIVRRWAPQMAPFFLWLTPHAPHSEKGNSGGPCGAEAVPAPGDQDLFSDAPLPRPPSFNERAIGDKPRFIRRLPRLDRDQIRELERDHRCRLASLREVDRGVKLLHATLADAGALDETVIIFTSDNGLFEGEHRLKGGKRLPYSEAVRVPLAALIPDDLLAGGGAPARVDASVANIDLAPTVLQFAGADPCLAPGDCRTMDGRSMVPLLEDASSGWPSDRALLLEMRRCRYKAVRTTGRLYVRHRSVPLVPGQSGDCRKSEVRERYNLERDPFELRNLGRPRASSSLVDRLRELSHCAGIQGRDAPTPGSSGFCD